MRSFCIVVLVLISVSYVLSQAVMLDQPGSTVVKPSGTLKTTCKVSVSVTSYHWHWVRQKTGSGLEYIGHITTGGGTYYAPTFQGKVTLTRETSKNELYFEMPNMRNDDSAIYYCARDRDTGNWAFDYWGPGTLVTVTTVTQKPPTVFPLMPCCGSQTFETQVTVGCLARGYFPEPVDVKWNSGSITSGIKKFPSTYKDGLFSSTSLVKIAASEWVSGKLQCNVEHVPTSTKINKEIPACTSTPTESSPTLKLLQGPCDDKADSSSVELVCLIYDYAPKDIKVQWMLNGKATSISPTNSTPIKNEEGTYESRSKVLVPKADWNAGDIYTCKVIHDATSSHPEVNIRKCTDSTGVHPRISIYAPTPKDIHVTKECRVRCEVSHMESTEHLSITWSRSDNKKILEFTSSPEQQHDGTYTVTSDLKITPQDWNREAEFTCTIKDPSLPTPVIKTIKKQIDTIKEPTIYLYPPAPEELGNHDFVNVLCLLKKFYPENIYVQWKKDGVLQKEDYYFNTTPVMEEEEDYFTVSKLSIAKSDWMRGATITCIGVHDQVIQKEIKKTRGK